MLKALLYKIAALFTIPYVTLFHAGGYTVPKTSDVPPAIQQIMPAQEIQAPQGNLGATNAISDTVALFQTTLLSPIAANSTAMTLVDASYNKGASTLASSTYGFVIDEGTSIEELVLADCTGTVCTNMSRGIDRLTGTTSVASLAFAHRRGASVKITNAPSQLKLNRIVQGIDTFPSILNYTSHPTFTGATNLIDKKYVDDTAFSGAGAIAASETAVGYSELATQLETASSSVTGSVGPLVIQAKNATSTYNSATAPLRVVVTQNSGQIDNGFIATSTLYKNSNLTGTTTLAATTTLATPTAFLDSTGNPILYSLLGTSTLAANNATWSITNIPARKHLTIYLQLQENVAGAVPQMTFNSDTGSHYTQTGTSTVVGTSQAAIQEMFTPGNTLQTGTSTITMEIWDGGGGIKAITAVGFVAPASNVPATVAVVPLQWHAIWAPGSNQSISSIQFKDSGGNLIVGGSHIEIYGSAF